MTKAEKIMNKAIREDRGITIVLDTHEKYNAIPVHVTFKNYMLYSGIKNTLRHERTLEEEMELEVDLETTPSVARIKKGDIVQEVKIKNIDFPMEYRLRDVSKKLYAYLVPGLGACEKLQVNAREWLERNKSIKAKLSLEAY